MFANRLQQARICRVRTGLSCGRVSFISAILGLLLTTTSVHADMKIVSPDGQFMYLVQSHFVWKHTNEGKAGGNKPSAFLWRSTLDSDATAVGANRSLVAVADRASLYVLNARDGKRLQKTPLARNVSLTRLVFTADGKAVVATTNRNKSIRFSAPPPDRN